MEIRSGTTGERRIRNSISLIMFVGFAAWFAYDGFYGYPAKNLKETQSAMPQPRPEKLVTNPRVVRSNLSKLKPGMTLDELSDLLGEPALIEDRVLHYVGRTMDVSIRINEQGTVSTVITKPIEPEKRPQYYNPLVFESQVAKITAGMPEAQVKSLLMDPKELQHRILWFVGPAAYVRVPVADGRVADALDPSMFWYSPYQSEDDIRVQKGLAALLGLVSLYIAWILFRTLTTSAVLDDSGLTLNGRRIAFTDMKELDISEYKNKGWVTLVFEHQGQTRRQRIDSYHFARFREIISALCEIKGFTSPFQVEASSDSNAKLTEQN